MSEGKSMSSNSMKVIQFELFPQDGHAIYADTLDTASAFVGVCLLSANNVPTVIKSAVTNVTIFTPAGILHDTDLATEVEHDALRPGEPDVLRIFVPNRLLVAEGFKPLEDAKVQFLLTVHHHPEGGDPKVFIHEEVMELVPWCPHGSEINIEFKRVVGL